MRNSDSAKALEQYYEADQVLEKIKKNAADINYHIRSLDKNMADENEGLTDTAIYYVRHKIYMLDRLLVKLAWIKPEIILPENEDKLKTVTDEYSIRGNAEEGFEIIIPLLQKKATTRTQTAEKKSAEALRIMTEKYLLEKGINVPVYEGRCLLAFTMCFGNDFDGMPCDPQNADTKHIIDAMISLMFPDDGMSHVAYFIEGIRVEEECSYTRIRIGRI